MPKLQPQPTDIDIDRTAASATLVAPRQFEIKAGPIPRPQANQIRVRIEGCGICGSNIPVWEGRDWFEYPLAPGAPGHEGWGIVDEVGENVHEFETGQRVVCLCYHAFAEYDIAEAGQVIVLPETLATTPFPGEPLACAMNVFRRCQINSGDSVAIIGIGFLGALVVQLAVQAGARVTAISRRSFALEVAKQCGAKEVISLADIQDNVSQFADGFSHVVEATGSQAALDLATQLVGVRGLLIVAGYHQDGPREVNMQQWNWKGIDVVNAHERAAERYLEGMKLAVEAVSSGDIQLDNLLTHQFPLNEINAAFMMATERQHGFLKAVISNDLTERE